MGAHPVTQMVVYGDLETVTTHQEWVTELSAQDNLEVVGWFHDPEGLRLIPEPSEAPGLVGALAECARARVALHIPFPVDAPGEQRWRLIAHWLHTRGLRLLISGSEYVWDVPTDAIDYAVRRTLDSASDLAAAVVAKGAMPALEDLLGELLGESGGQDGRSGTEMGPDGARAKRPISEGVAQTRTPGTTSTVWCEPSPGLSSPRVPLAEFASESDAQANLNDAKDTITDLREEIGVLRRLLEALEEHHSGCAECVPVPVPPVINADAMFAALPENLASGPRGVPALKLPWPPQGLSSSGTRRTKRRSPVRRQSRGELETLHQNAAAWVTEGEKLELSDQFQRALFYYEVASRSVKALVELLETEP